MPVSTCILDLLLPHTAMQLLTIINMKRQGAVKTIPISIYEDTAKLGSRNVNQFPRLLNSRHEVQNQRPRFLSDLDVALVFRGNERERER